jgi:soluble lytic murein transglycosylase-like protein
MAKWIALFLALSSDVSAQSFLLVFDAGNTPKHSAKHTQIRAIIQDVANEVGIDWRHLDALVAAESKYDPKAVSRVGAFGYTQLMPGTAADLGVNRYDELENLRGGARYFKSMLAKFNRLDLAYAAYNAGPGSVAPCWCVPPYKETRRYVAKILARLN